MQEEACPIPLNLMSDYRGKLFHLMEQGCSQTDYIQMLRYFLPETMLPSEIHLEDIQDLCTDHLWRKCTSN